MITDSQSNDIDRDVALLARIIEHTPIGIVILRHDRSIYYVNLIAEHLLNCGRQVLLGSSIDPYIVNREGEVPWHDLWSELMQGKIKEAKIGLARSESDEVVCKLTAFHLVGKDSQPDAVALMFRDITHELIIAEQLENKNIEMAKMNTELIRSNVELRRLSEMKSNFLSIASHELKTPLTSIKGYSDIIVDGMKDRIDEGVYRMVESINRAADRLHKVINNILDVTRIEQKRLKLKPEQLDLTAIARDCIEEHTQLSVRRNITFESSFAPDLPPFYGDKMRMHQVFSNLCSNAVKFSPDGAAVHFSIATDASNNFHIIIKDSGIGIDKSEQKNIFDPFYEVGDISRHSTDHVKFMGGGTGLGLSIARGIVERHGGRIWVESDGVATGEYNGSEFHIVLPIRSEISWNDNESEDNRMALIAEQQMKPAEKMVEEKPTILFIDADREAIEVARMVLDSAFDIISASNGEMGLSLAFQYKPSMILLDVALPGLDGYRICKILRSQDETRDTPIAFLSTLTTSAEIEKCFRFGADDFMIKPFSGRELLDKIWRLLIKKKESSMK